MIELERHIEILLLSNDCVIVPNLGGFMTHHVDAHYDDKDNMFLPPRRTLGFNPQLKINDSLLAQSYIEAYDISYPEAIRRIEGEVAEMKQHLENKGYYELNDLGLLRINDEGRVEFEPCEAGILTPSLYGLSGFEMMPLADAKTQKIVESKDEEKPVETEVVDSMDEEKETEDKEEAVVIKMSWVRNAVAVAAAILVFFFMATPVSNDVQSGLSVSQMNLPIMTKDSNTKQADMLDKQAVKEVLANNESVPSDVPVEPVEDKEKAVEPVDVPVVKPTVSYCIVMASQVSQRNAEDFVSQLQKKGYSDARVYLNNNIRRVVCGSFETESEAYKQLHKVHRDQSLADAWVYKIKHKD